MLKITNTSKIICDEAHYSKKISWISCKKFHLRGFLAISLHLHFKDGRIEPQLMVEVNRGEIIRRCRQQGILITASFYQKLSTHSDPLAILQSAKEFNINGVLDKNHFQLLAKLLANSSQQPPLLSQPLSKDDSAINSTLPENVNLDITQMEPTPHSPMTTPILKTKPQSTVSLKNAATEQIRARTVAPMVTPQPLAPHLMEGLQDYEIEDFPTLATDVDVDFQVHFDITGNSVTEGKMDDIYSHFTNRLERIKKMIVMGGELPSRVTELNRLLSDRQAFTGRDNIACAVGLVNEPRNTKNGHLIFELEDNTSSITCLLRKDEDDPNPIISHGLMPDDVIGVSGTFSNTGDLFYVNDLHFPPLRRRTRKHATEAQVSVAFLSDIHVGSKTFLEAQWNKMIQWFHNDPLAKTIKYFVLSGDCVDGIGIYPNQDKELAIPDLFNQYDEFARLLHQLPDWVECIMLPGNHDAVRPAEPQPALEPEIQQSFNTTKFVGNPCDFSLHGVRILSYHGKSIDDYVSGMRNVTYANPVQAMREMMQRRHLAPQWGGKTPLSPEPEDNLVINTVPDIFVTGHVHGHACTDHKGTTLICSSTWQDQTSYQRMLGFQPKPCILTVVNLGTHMTANIPFA